MGACRTSRGSSKYVRKALNEGELVDYLSALVGDMLLCGVELRLIGVFLEGDLSGFV